MSDNSDERTDPFAKIAAGSPSPASGSKPAPDPGKHIAPAPGDAPDLPSEWRVLGAPVAAWPYRDEGGAILRWTLRFVKADGSKDIRPATLWREPSGRLRWRLAGEPGPRPLYGLDRLGARPTGPVLVVEGEKTADQAAQLFPDFVAVTWPGGAKAASKVDWAPLVGRDVVIFPDADPPGRRAAQDVARFCTAAGALTTATVDPPGFLPVGWDLADEWPEGFGLVQAAALIAASRAKAQPAGVEWPWGFRMEEDGLWYDQPTPAGGVAPTRLCAPFEVLGEARDPDGGGWAVVLRFRDRDGREKTVPVSRGRLSGGGAEVRAELADIGLVVSPQRGKADKFSIALAEVRCVRRLTLVAATGWCGDRFVLPGQVIGSHDQEAVIFTGESAALHYRKVGSLSGWQNTIAASAPGNDLMALAISLAFLGPLLRPLELEGGGVHFRGSSSCGKTTLAYAAGSVWGGGGPLGFGQTWRSTANALEMVAFGHNDGLAVFDELALVAPEEAGAAAYSLASGQSKARSRADGSLRRRSEWRVALLSTGEISLAEHIRGSKRGERPMTGQELRLLDVSADAGARMGIWAKVGSEGPAAMSDAIKAACSRDYGYAGPAFVEALTARRADLLDHGKALVAAFVKTVERDGDTGQAHRAALRFGAIAAAGELATLLGVTGWPAGTASNAAARLYERWAVGFGRDVSHEAGEILRRMRGILESEAANFAPLGDDAAEEEFPTTAGRDEQARGLKSYGYRRVRGAQIEYWLNDVGWDYATQGFGRQEAARALWEAGFLAKGEGAHWRKRQSLRGRKVRYWTIKGELVEADLNE